MRKDTPRKRLDDMTPEELAAETAAWQNGDFADGTWEDAPEAIITKSKRVEDMTREELVAEVTAWRERAFSRYLAKNTLDDVDEDLL